MTASPTGGGVRVLRATTLAVVTLALAATAHVLAGGDLPGVLALALAAGPLALGTVLLTRRRLSLAAVFAWLVPAEITLHVYFERPRRTHWCMRLLAVTSTAAPTQVCRSPDFPASTPSRSRSGRPRWGTRAWPCSARMPSPP